MTIWLTRKFFSGESNSLCGVWQLSVVPKNWKIPEKKPLESSQACLQVSLILVNRNFACTILYRLLHRDVLHRNEAFPAPEERRRSFRREKHQSSVGQGSGNKEGTGNVLNWKSHGAKGAEPAQPQGHLGSRWVTVPGPARRGRAAGAVPSPKGPPVTRPDHLQLGLLCLGRAALKPAHTQNPTQENTKRENPNGTLRLRGRRGRAVLPRRQILIPGAAAEGTIPTVPLPRGQPPLCLYRGDNLPMPHRALARAGPQPGTSQTQRDLCAPSQRSL